MCLFNLTAMKKIKRPIIRHMAPINALMGYGKKKEWSVARKLKEIRKAGFDGVAGRVPPITRELLEKNGLLLAATVDIGKIGDIRPKLRAAKEAGACCVNSHLMDHDTPAQRSLEVTRRYMEIGEAMGLDVAVEMHRDTCTETPEKMYGLARDFEKVEKRPLKVTWDFSHPAVTKHLKPPYWERLAERPDLIQLAQQFHFRPFNGHHCQIAVLNHKGKLTPEFKDWLEFAEKVIECWLEKATPGRELFICPELIPFGYTLSVFGDRWKDTLATTKAVDKVWKRQLRKWKPPKE